ncbi:MAG: twin-arginine translocation signal domain-containing protein [Sedimentisphaerales bacterium]|nr:twin-arginine translocation signal domain-containing protein [Sedimentisphaerales bacterium]
MSQSQLGRRDFLKAMGLSCAAAACTAGPLAGQQGRMETSDFISVDPEPRFDLSPYLYMQFMEPLGVTDGSVDAAWDFGADRWREDVVEITQELAPTLMRWGGCFCSYYRWKEGVGPMDRRRPMLNQLWGGIYNNQVGTREFVEFCRRVAADPLIVVNFESDGRTYWATSPKGRIRSGNATEAAEWVDYCNSPANTLRRQHGVPAPYNVRLWQIGNETSYGAAIDVDTAAKKTVEFARAMRKADPTIDIIGWGDSGWAARMAEIAGQELQYIAFHNGFGPGGADSPLHGIEYRKDPAKTWAYLMKTCKTQEAKLNDMRSQVARYGIPLAMTECHFGLPGRNRCEVLSTWAAGVANARIMNVHERNGDLLKIATLADFCGTRWQNNAVMIPVPGGRSFMMPVAMVMSLYRKHSGKQNVSVARTPDGLDVTASRTGNRLFLHVVNTRRTQPVKCAFQIQGTRIAGGQVYWFDLDPEFEVFEYRPECVFAKEKTLEPDLAWTFPAASVSAVELTMEPA